MRRLLSFALLLPAMAAAQPPAGSPAATPAPTPAAAPPAASADTAGRTPQDSARAARGTCSSQAECAAVAERRRQRRTPVRQAVTPDLERSAFADATARTLLTRARQARLAQDSALRAYDARTYQRLSVGVGLRAIGRERLLFRGENAARVRWARGQGVSIEPLAARAVAPAFKEAKASFDVGDFAPLPYFPGRETLWFPSGDMKVARAEVDERDMLHPLATGAEAYYRYATGDSVSFRLPDGSRVTLREMRITARRPQWRAFVGSFWFDAERGSLVRAGYRMAADMDIWDVAGEDARREFDQAIAKAGGDARKAYEEALSKAGSRLDTARAREQMNRAIELARRTAGAEREDDDVPTLVKGLINPMRATISAITVEYGLYEGRFWLPRLNVAEGEAQAGFIRMPVRVEERYRYDAVNAAAAPLRIPTPTELGLGDDTTSYAQGSITIGDAGPDTATTAAGRATRDSARVRGLALRVDSLQRRLDSAVTRADTARTRQLRQRLARARVSVQMAARRRDECARDSTYFAGVRTRHDDDVPMRVAVRRPCDPTRLERSAELPGSIYEPGEGIFGTAERDALLAALESFDLQPGWSPQRPDFRTGPAFLRFNRVEGLSVGGEATSVLGLGFTAQASARIGVSDLVPNGELALSRSNGRQTLRGAVFHRLGVANDDWGAPLSFGASLANLLYARDEGFYYRTWGAELTGTRARLLGGAPLAWRLFAERQRGATRELRQTITGADFIPNIAGERATLVGTGGELARTFGVDPTGWRLFARGRTEGAWVDWSADDSTGRAAGYGRGLADATLSRGLGRFAAAITGAAGGIAGDAPTQRLFYVGGYQTVRGQFARPDTAGYVGNAFWMTRSELGFNTTSARPSVFYDMGWAGDRRDFSKPGRPLSGYGLGISFLDGLVRADLSRGLWPEKRTRFDVIVEARF